MKKIIFTCIVAALIGFGCGDDGDVYNQTPTDEATKDLTQNETPAETETSCNNPQVAELACTSARRIDGLLDPNPYVVSNWIFDRVKAANRQCKEYADLIWIYQEAMRAINSGDDPMEVKTWFTEIMADVVDYDPTEES